MLSRRHLRVRVLQALYALQAAHEANFELGLDFIADSFKPDLNSMTPQEPLKLEGMRKIATLLFEENYKQGIIPTDDDTLPKEAIVAAKNALKYFQDLSKKDYQRIQKQLTPQVESIYGTSYIAILQLLVELMNLSKIERDRQYEDPEVALARLSGLDNNSILIALANNTAFQNEAIRHENFWSKIDKMLIRKMFRDDFRTNETYRNYAAKATHTPTEDLELLQYVMREIVFKNEEIINFFEINDLYWQENSDLVRKMVIKTLKSGIETEGIKLAELTDDWEQDSFFMEELFEQTIQRSDELEKLIAEPLKNWDSDRLASIDYLILKMSLAEMMTFQSIPVKVTLNEAIEIAKAYSTPKSAKFVNGILDTLSKTLLKSNKIRKSGRGLLDNK